MVNLQSFQSNVWPLYFFLYLPKRTSDEWNQQRLSSFHQWPNIWRLRKLRNMVSLWDKKLIVESSYESYHWTTSLNPFGFIKPHLTGNITKKSKINVSFYNIFISDVLCIDIPFNIGSILIFFKFIVKNTSGKS